MAKSNLLLCPHCSNENHHELLVNHNLVPPSYDSDGKPTEGPSATYQVFKCSTCKDISVYFAFDGDPPQLQYPQDHLLDPCVAVSVRKIYREAKAVQNRSPDAFAIMMGRALEALCDDKGVSSNNLYESLKKLANDRIIPPVLIKMGSALRLLRNAAAHHTNQEITVPQTLVVDKLFRAIIEYVYIAPELLADFEETQKKEKKSQ